MAERELAAVVVMQGTVYGPGYVNPPPADVAKRITNPLCWGEEVDREATESPNGEQPDEPAAPSAPPAPSGPAVPTPVEPTTVQPKQVPVPPRSGAGSGLAAWRAFADDREVGYEDGASRDDIIEACEKAKVI